MSTGPGPTRKADGSSDASVDDIADLLVEHDAGKGQAHPQEEHPLDDSLDVMLETPGPAVVSTFMPPPPSLPHATDDNGSETEDRENAEEGSGESNLAYEDLLAKLVLPAGKTAAPEAPLQAPTPLPMPELSVAPLPPALEQLMTPAPTPAPAAYQRSSASIPLTASSTDERTLVTENPLLAEEQEAAAREGRTPVSRDQAPQIQEEIRYAVTQPVSQARSPSTVTKTKIVYFLAGGLVTLVGMTVAVLVFKLLVHSPTPPVPVATPTAAPLPLAPPPAKVEPLPSAPPAAAAVPAPPPEPEPSAAAPEHPAAPEEPAAEDESAKAAPKPHKAAPKRPAHVAKAPAPAPAPAAKTAAKVAPPPAAPAAKPVKAAAPAPKPAKAAAGGKKGKAGGYADPFEN